MPESPQAQSPLHDVCDEGRRDASDDASASDTYIAGDDHLRLCERAFLGHYVLRARADDVALLASISKVLGCALPCTPNCIASVAPATSDASTMVLWLAPDEWLILSPHTQRDALWQSLMQTIAGTFAVLNNLSSGQTVIRVSGAGATALLQRACTIDLHPQQFPTGQCAQTLLAKTNVTLIPTEQDGARSYDIIVRRSFAEHLWHWLKDASDLMHPPTPTLSA